MSVPAFPSRLALPLLAVASVALAAALVLAVKAQRRGGRWTAVEVAAWAVCLAALGVLYLWPTP